MAEHTRVARARLGIERRIFLKALALGVSAPIAWQLSRAAVAQAQTARPKRLMLFFMPHGAPPEHFNPVINGGDPTNFTLNQSGVSILGPLEPYKQYVNVLQGFEYPGASTHEGILTVLSNYGVPNDESTPRTSFEHVIANGLGARPLILGAIPHRQWGIDKDGKLMWDGQPVVPQNNPLVAFDATFGNLNNPDPQLAVKTQLREALTTLNEGQLNSLSTELQSLTRTRAKLQIHLESVQALRAGLGGQQSCGMAPSLPAIDSLRALAQGEPAEFFLDEGKFVPILNAQLQLAAQALICNTTPVVAVQPMYTNADINFEFIPGSEGSHHSALSHTGPVAQGAGLALETRTAFANAQRWFVERLVENVVDRLAVPDPADPGRQVLDNTIIYMFSEIGEGAWHTSKSSAIQLGATPNAYAYMPMITIGGGGGALRTGQVVNVNPNAAGDDRPAGDVYLALARAMGVEVTSFGNATNPLTEILI
jgi:hypothetical protein